MNTASRVCSTGIKYKINISEAAYQCAQFHHDHMASGNLSWDYRADVSMKGKGTMNCYVLQYEDGERPEHRDSAGLDEKFVEANKYSSRNTQRNSMPRWMIQGSILVKQNAKQSSNVYANRLQEVAQRLDYNSFSLKFADIDARNVSNIIYTDVGIQSADSLEQRFRDEQFQKRKHSSNWFLFVLFMWSLSALVFFTGFISLKSGNGNELILKMVIPWTLFSISCITYVCYSFFLSLQMRSITAIFEISTLIISAIT